MNHRIPTNPLFNPRDRRSRPEASDYLSYLSRQPYKKAGNVYPLYLPTQAGRWRRLCRRGFEIGCSLGGIVLLLSWLLPILGLLIILESRGPVLFSQRRGGRYQKPFTCFKLRTMRPHAHADDFNTRPDAKYITPFGQWLRRTSLDELPQFFNVLMGNMALVGPRPHMLAHDDYYAKRIPNYALRYSVKPGITGLAQVSGCRGNIESDRDMIQRVQYDLFYIHHRSVWMDLKILWRTVFHRTG